MHALEQIRRDLRDLEQRRRVALGTYLGLLAVFVAVFFLQPTGPRALVRDAGWLLAFGLLLAGALLGAVVTIGYPLISRLAVYVVSALMASGCAAALLLTVDTSAASAPVSAGIPCFLHSTAVSAAAMLALGAISGRVWRRFPDPGFPLALGATGVGLATLHMRCGGVDPLHLFGFHLGPLLALYALAHYLVRAREDLSRDA